MKNLKISSLVVGLLFLVSGVCWGQSVFITPAEQLSEVEEDNEMVLVKDDNGQTVQINFVCKVSGDTCSTFDVRKNSPYHHFSFPLAKGEMQTYQHLSYDVSNIPKQKILGMFKNAEFATPAALERIGFHQMDVFYSIAPNLKQNPNHIGITYTMLNFDRLGGSIAQATLTTLVVLNNKGEVIFSVKDFNNQASFPLATPNGRYVVFTYGGLMAHTDWQAPEGIIAIDLQERKKILHKNISSLSGYPWLVEDKVILGKYSNRKHCYFINDFNKQLIYIKEYPGGSFAAKLRKIQVDGFLFKDGHKDYYEQDFYAEPFSTSPLNQN